MATGTPREEILAMLNHKVRSLDKERGLEIEVLEKAQANIIRLTEDIQKYAKEHKAQLENV